MKIIGALKIAVFLSILFPAITVQAGSVDPLSPNEFSVASQIAAPALRSHRSGTAQAAGTTVADSMELLLIERRPTDKDYPEQRLADVYRYDYQSDETVHTIIDIDNQSIISSQRQQYLQLPLTGNELDRASQIAFSDAEQIALISDEYLRITGQYLTSPDQLDIKAFVFTARTMPEQLNAASQACGLHRCAQLLLYTHDSVVFEISPIVNLSAGIVTQNIGY